MWRYDTNDREERKKLDVYTINAVLLRASIELCRLAISGDKWASGNDLRNLVLVPAWDAGGFIQEELQAEMMWQQENIEPQIEAAFDKVRVEEEKLKRQKKSSAVVEKQEWQQRNYTQRDQTNLF